MQDPTVGPRDPCKGSEDAKQGGQASQKSALLATPLYYMHPAVGLRCKRGSHQLSPGLLNCRPLGQGTAPCTTRCSWTSQRRA